MTAIKNFLKIILYKPLFNLLVYIVYLIPGNNIGWAIVILTVLIRLALYPSQKNSIVSQKKMAEIQPQIEEIKKKYKDQQQQAQAIMNLYKQNKVNPLGSCLPLLIQLPILIILYRVFTVGLNTDRFDLLYNFTPRPEVINTMFCGIDLANPSIVLAVLAGVLQFIQSWQMQKMQKPINKIDKDKKPGIENMMGDFSKQMMYMFPIMTVIIAIKLPAALAIYWIITTLFMVIQQYFVSKHKDTINPKGITVKIKNSNQN